MLDLLLLGVLQGILEWLPVSSQGFVTMALGLMGAGANAVDLTLYLHSGTMLSVLVYFRKDVLEVLSNLPGILREKRGLARFLVVSTVISFAVALPLYHFIGSVAVFMGASLLLVVGMALVITGFVLKKTKAKGLKKISALDDHDAIAAGALQGLAVVPGLSRSALTVFALLSRGYRPESAIKASFIMSIPAVLGANLFLVATAAPFSTDYLIAIAAAFAVGLLTIDLLIRVSRKIDFTYFCWLFGALSILSAILFI